MSATQNIAFSRRETLGESNWCLGHMMTVLVSSGETGGRYGLLETLARRGLEPPRHIHHREDETCYVLEGEVSFFPGDQTIHARPGDCVFLPRGIPHHFRIHTETVRMLILLTPGGVEDYFREFFVPARTLELPQLDPTDMDPAKLMEAGARYGVEFLPPGS
jgi:quercetin dioxygenase-like cupin family protein